MVSEQELWTPPPMPPRKREEDAEAEAEAEWAATAAKRARVEATCHAVPFYAEDRRAYEPPPTLARTALSAAENAVRHVLGLPPATAAPPPPPPPPQPTAPSTYDDSDDDDCGDALGATGALWAAPTPQEQEARAAEDAKVAALEDEADRAEAADAQQQQQQPQQPREQDAELAAELRAVPVGGLQFLLGGVGGAAGRATLRRHWLGALAAAEAMEAAQPGLYAAVRRYACSGAYAAPDPALFAPDAPRPLWTPVLQPGVPALVYDDVVYDDEGIGAETETETEQRGAAVLAGALPHVGATAEFVARGAALTVYDTRARTRVARLVLPRGERISAVASVHVNPDVFSPAVQCAVVVATNRAVRMYPYVRPSARARRTGTPEEEAPEEQEHEETAETETETEKEKEKKNWLKEEPSHTVVLAGGEDVAHVASTPAGRVFLGARNSSVLHELYYDVRFRARLVRHALTLAERVPGVGALLGALRGLTGARGATGIAQLAVDATRDLLYVLTEASAVHVLHAAGTGTRYLRAVGAVADVAQAQAHTYPDLPLLAASVVPPPAVVAQLHAHYVAHDPAGARAAHLRSTALAWRALARQPRYVPRAVACIEPVSAARAPELAFVAYTSVGCRLYFQLPRPGLPHLLLVSARAPPPGVLAFPFDRVTAAAARNTTLLAVTSLTRPDSFALVSLVHCPFTGPSSGPSSSSSGTGTDTVGVPQLGGDSAAFRETVEAVTLTEPVVALWPRTLPYGAGTGTDASSAHSAVPPCIRSAARAAATVRGRPGEALLRRGAETHDDALASALGDERAAFTVYMAHSAVDVAKRTVADVVLGLAGRPAAGRQHRALRLLRPYAPAYRYHVLLCAMCAATARHDTAAVAALAALMHRLALTAAPSSSSSSSPAALRTPSPFRATQTGTDVVEGGDAVDGSSSSSMYDHYSYSYDGNSSDYSDSDSDSDEEDNNSREGLGAPGTWPGGCAPLPSAPEWLDSAADDLVSGTGGGAGDSVFVVTGRQARVRARAREQQREARRQAQSARRAEDRCARAAFAPHFLDTLARASAAARTATQPARAAQHGRRHLPRGVAYTVAHSLRPVLAAPLCVPYYDPARGAARLVLAWDRAQLAAVRGAVRDLRACVRTALQCDAAGRPERVLALAEQCDRRAFVGVAATDADAATDGARPSARDPGVLALRAEAACLLLDEVEQLLAFVALLGAARWARVLALLPAAMRAFVGNCELSQLLAAERGAACVAALMALYVRVEAERGAPVAATLARLRAACPLHCTADTAALCAVLGAASPPPLPPLHRTAAAALCATPLLLAPRDMVSVLARLGTGTAHTTGVRWRVALLRAQARAAAAAPARWTSAAARARHTRLVFALLLDTVAGLVAPLPRDAHYDVPSAANGYRGTLSGRADAAAWEAQVAAFLQELLCGADGADAAWVRALVAWLAAHDYSRFFLGLDSAPVAAALAAHADRHSLLPRHLQLRGAHWDAAEAFLAAAACTDVPRALARRTADAECALAELARIDAAPLAPPDARRLGALHAQAATLRYTLRVQRDVLRRVGAAPDDPRAARLIPLAELHDTLAAQHGLYDVQLRIEAHTHAGAAVLAATWRRMLQHVLAAQPPLAHVAAEVARHARALRADAPAGTAPADLLPPVADLAAALEAWAAAQHLPVAAAASAHVLGALPGLAPATLLRGLHAALLDTQHLNLPVRERLSASILHVLEGWLTNSTTSSPADDDCDCDVDVDPHTDPTVALVMTPGTLALVPATEAAFIHCQELLASPAASSPAYVGLIL